MDKLRSLTVAAAVAFALAACAQNETAPDDTTASTSGSTTASSESSSSYPDSSSSTAGATTADSGTGSMSQSDAGASADAGASPGSVAIGLQVETETGESIGTVTDIVADPATGAPLYAVISTEGETTAMPFDAASSMVQADALVVERTRLASAPRVEQSELHELTADWTSEANEYWGRGELRTASPEPGVESEPRSPEPEPTPESEPRG